MLWVYTLNSTTSKSVIDGVGGSMALAGGKLYMGDYRGELICLDGQHGRLLWRFATGAQVLATPVVVSGFVYFGSRRQFLCSQYPNRASCLALHNRRSAQFSLACGGHLFVGSLNGAMYAFS